MKTIQVSAAILVVALSATADAFEPGVYATTNSAQFIFTAKRAVAVRDGECSEIGMWKQEQVGGKECVVLKTWGIDKEWVDPTIWVFEEAEGGIRPCGRGRGSITNVLANGAEIRKLRGDAPELHRLPGALTLDLEKSVNDEVAKFLRTRKKHLDMVALNELGERISRNPEELLKVEPEYPTLDSDEDDPGPGGAWARYPEKMRLLGEVLMNPHVKFKEETLLKFLDKLDWDRGDLFALGTLRHPAITAEGLRRLAPKVFARFGKSDDFLVSMFFADPRTPLDVLEAARKNGGYGEHTAKAIAERLDKDVGNE